MPLKPVARSIRNTAKAAAGTTIGYLALAIVRVIRLMNPDRAARYGGAILRTVGPLLPEHRIARENLKAAFPDKPDTEIKAILSGAWDNLGRIGGEFAHLDRLWDFSLEGAASSRIEIPDQTIELFKRLRDDGVPALVFTAHLANWELPALAAAANDIPSAALYRAPNISQVDRLVREVRSLNMGELIPTGYDAPARLIALLNRGVHVGMLVDQYYDRGVDVTFFGRTARTNPLIARLLRYIECPVHGVRVIRLPGSRFRIELTEAIAPVRLPNGEIDIAGTMQAITNVVEGWIREYPEQWLWMHRRWRPERQAFSRRRS